MPGSPGMPQGPDPARGPRAALIVATSVYADESLRRLRAPARDAADLADVLADPEIGGFDVSSVIDATAHEVRLGIERFLSGRGPEDLVVMYLSCHGVLNSRSQLYFAAGDTLKEHLGSTGVESRWVLEQLDDCRAKRQVLILDCCFSGAFARGAKGETELDLGRHLVGHGRGRIVLTASRAGEYSFEGEALPGAAESGSVFTSGLVEGLRTGAADADNDGYVSVEDAYDYAFEHVRARRAGQTPQRWSYGAEGRIWLAFNPAVRAAAVVPAPVPESIRAGLANPHPEIQLGAVSVLGQWLGGADAARALMARGQLELMTGSEIPSVAGAARSLLVGGAAARLGEVASNATPTSAKPDGWVGSKDRGLVGANTGLVCLATFGRQAGGVNAVAFCPTRPLLATCGNDNTVVLWNVDDPSGPTLVGTMKSHRHRVHTVAFSPDGLTLATRGADRDVDIWVLSSASKPSRDFSVSVGGDPERFSGTHALAFSPNGRFLAVGGERATVLKLPIRMFSKNKLATLDEGHWHVTAVAFSPNGRLLAIRSTETSAVDLWDMSDPAVPSRAGQNNKAMAPPTAASALAFSPDGAHMAVSQSTSIELLELRGAAPISLKTLAVFGHCTGGVINVVAFSPNGRLLATSDGSTVLLWDIADLTAPRLHAAISDPVHFVDAVAFSSDGTLLATGGKQARLWKLG